MTIEATEGGGRDREARTYVGANMAQIQQLIMHSVGETGIETEIETNIVHESVR